jgi:transcriptional regulator with XRE-family HTH domain
MTEHAKQHSGPYEGSLRQGARLTLREFCRRAGTDPANINRMERGLVPPPKDRDILERYATALRLRDGTDDWYTFLGLAAVAQGTVPADTMADAGLVSALPLFFRALRGQKPSPKEVCQVAASIQAGARG